MNDTVAGIPCNLCGGVQVTVLARRSRSGEPLRTVACCRCGLVWSDPRPHQARQFYEEDYRLAYKQTFEPRPKHVLRAGKVALSRLQKIRPYLRGRMRILDVGSGGGEFAYLLESLGHQVQGVEPNRGYAAYAARQYGLHITRGFIGDLTLEAASYDLVTIWHVLEHTEDPAAVLAHLKRALRPEGVLVVEVPNVEATCQSPAGTFHEAHLFNFNLATLGLLGFKSGLYPCASRVAADGGNITTVFRPLPVEPSLPGNHEQVATIVQRHTPASHWLSLHPYRRLVGRIARLATEWLETRRPASARERLDGLYARVLRPAGAAGLSGISWKLVLGTYAAALLLEWMLLDEFLPKNGWSEHEALSVYTALQGAMVAGVIWLTPLSKRQLAKLAAWAAPLFALPIYC